MSRKLLFTFVAAGLLIVCCAPLLVAAGEEKSPETAGAAPAASQGSSEAEMMDAMMKAATPGEPHSRMKSMAGSWTMSVKSYFGPGEPKVSEGTCEAATILGDRYIKEECKGDFGGMPYQGMGIYGYDNLKKKYVSAWVDNMGTGIMLSQGTWDAKKKTFTYRSTEMDPLTLKNEPVKMVIKVDSEDSHTASFYGWKNGKDVLQMEITYTRK